MPSAPSSTPKPDCFQPPIGAYMSMAERPCALTNTVPAESRDATSAASASSLLQTEAHRPNGVSLAASTASVEVVVGDDGQRGGELLLAHDAARPGAAPPRAPGRRSTHPTPRPPPAPGRAAGPRLPPPAASATSASTRSRAAAGVHRAHGHPVGQAVADHLGRQPAGQRVDRLVQPVAVHVQALDRHADLSAGDEGRLDDAIGQGRVTGHVGRQDGGVVAPELEHDRPGGGGRGGHDGLAGADATGEGDHVDVGVAHQRGTERRLGPVHDVEHARRQRGGHGGGHEEHGARDRWAAP